MNLALANRVPIRIATADWSQKIERASADLTPYDVVSIISRSNDGYRTSRLVIDSGSLPIRQAFEIPAVGRKLVTHRQTAKTVEMIHLLKSNCVPLVPMTRSLYE